MSLSWMGEYRESIEKVIRFANNYSAIQNLEFMGEEIKYSFSQIQVIESLLENETKHLKMAEIAKKLEISTSSFTKHVNKLVNKGLLEKYHVKGNKKDVIVCVTDEGKKLYKSYVDTYAKRVFKDFLKICKGAGKKEIETFNALMEAMLKVYNKGEEVVVLEAIDG